MTKKKFLLIVFVIIALPLMYYGFVTLRLSSQGPSNESLEDLPGTIITDGSQLEDLTNNAEGMLNQSPPAAPSPAPATEMTLPTAILTGVSGRSVSGTAKIITTTEGTFIRLEDDFSSPASAPDNRVYLGDTNGHQVEIAKLKSISGGQNFLIPPNINASDYSHIWIHCKAFNTSYGVGEITH